MDLWPQADPEPLGKGRWPFYGKDLSNTRDGGKTGPAKDEVPLLGPAWSFYSRDGDFTGTPVVASGMVVVGSNTGRVYALDGATGKLRWQRKLGEEPINNSVAVERRARIRAGGQAAQAVDGGARPEDRQAALEGAARHARRTPTPTARRSSGTAPSTSGSRRSSARRATPR